MGRYLGKIQIINNFVNFMPFYEIVDGVFERLSSEEKQNLFPGSEYKNINLYSNREDRNRFAENFYENQLFIIELRADDYEESYSYTGEVNRTRYKINLDKLSSRQFGSLDKFDYYFYVPASDTSRDFSKAYMSVNTPNLPKDVKIVVERENSDRFAGPFTISIRSADGEKVVLTHEKDIRSNDLHLVPEIKRNYEKNELQEISIDIDNYIIWFQLFCASNREKSFFDVISDSNLLIEFKSMLANKYIYNGMLDLSDVDKVIESYSALNLNNIPREIQNKRVERLREILQNEKTLETNTDLVCQVIADTLVSQSGSETLDPVFDLIVDNPDFLNKVPRIRAFQTRLNELQIDFEKKNQELDNLRSQVMEREKAEISGHLSSEYEELQKKINEANLDLKALNAEIDELKGIKSRAEYVQRLEWQKEYLEGQIADRKAESETIEKNIDNIFNERTEKALNLTFDGMISQKMIQAAANWEADQQEKQYSEVIEFLNKQEVATVGKEEIVDYLCEVIQEYRPSYDKNTIINIFICIAQGFLTVFSGLPGTGKTSMCNIVAHVMGLNKSKTADTALGRINSSRYLDVSVERGWTSKRDFIGYYNPLTKKFDRNNSRLFDALNILHHEANGKKTNRPFIVLLDEANLSPMEYYWADFMNVCDDLNADSHIDLGEDYRFNIPDELRFVATINNDHTTEALSPRLLDRSWVIRLPFPQTGQGKTANLTDANVRVVLWSDFISVFGSADDEITGVSKEIYESFLTKARDIGVRVSPRSDLAIRKYWNTASGIMVKDESVFADPSIIALDYAISQKVLPQINGSRDDMKNGLEKLKSFALEKNLDMTAALLEEIINRGDDSMQFYQYFG